MRPGGPYFRLGDQENEVSFIFYGFNKGTKEKLFSAFIYNN